MPNFWLPWRRWAKPPFPQPLDRAALSVIGLVILATALLMGGGDRTHPQVRDFSWQDKTIGANDVAFILTFNRPMDWSSVTEQLRLEPPLAGKASWSGRRFAYTLAQPIPYGQSFTLSLENAESQTAGTAAQRAMVPYRGQFRSRHRALLYIGATGDNTGRLLLQPLGENAAAVALTPADLQVIDFQPYPNGDRALLSAAPVNDAGQVSLYTVSTGIHYTPPTDLAGANVISVQQQPQGEMRLLLDGRDYEILKFQLSANGRQIVLQLSPRQQPQQTGLWSLDDQGNLELLQANSGGDFLIAPDSETLVIAQGQGLAILPLNPGAESTTDPLSFLPQYGQVLSFAKDGTAAAVVKYNADFSRSLFLVSNQGDNRELFRTQGSILAAQFDPRHPALYAILTDLVSTDPYLERPYLARLSLETGEEKRLLELPSQQDFLLDVAPDGLGLVFDQAVAGDDWPASLAHQGKATSNLWWLPLTKSGLPAASPRAVAQGFRGRWLP